MRLGLDLHGVITDIPDTMKFLSSAIVSAGGQVHILTGGSIQKATLELRKLGLKGHIHFTHIFSVLDYHRYEILTPHSGWNDKYDNPEYPHRIWDRTKADYCSRNKIDLMIDDSLIYNQDFTTPFARLWTHTDTPKIDKPKRHLT